MKKLLFVLVSSAFLTIGVSAEPISVASWNVEDHDFGGRDRASGSDGALIAIQLRDDFNKIDVFALSEVNTEGAAQVYATIAGQDEEGDYSYIYGQTGNSLHLALLVNTARFDILSSEELDFGFDTNDTRFPLAARLRSTATSNEYIVVANHLARGSSSTRKLQAEMLAAWSAEQDVPVIALGDFNFDYDIASKTGNSGWDAFQQSGYFEWSEPEVPVDTSWSGGTTDEYPNSILDFVFVGGDAKNWQSRSIVYARAGDFPDNGSTADHRPVVGLYETDSAATFEPDLAEYVPVYELNRLRFQPNNAVVPQMSRIAPAAQALTMDKVAPLRAESASVARTFEPQASFGEQGLVLPGTLDDFPPGLWPLIKSNPDLIEALAKLAKKNRLASDPFKNQDVVDWLDIVGGDVCSGNHPLSPWVLCAPDGANGR